MDRTTHAHFGLDPTAEHRVELPLPTAILEWCENVAAVKVHRNSIAEVTRSA